VARNAFLCQQLSHLGGLVARLGHCVVDGREDADLVATTNPVLAATPAVEVLQFGGAVIDDVPGGRYIPAPVTARAWRTTAAADMLDVALLARATLLTDPPRTGLHWTGHSPPPEPAYATPLATTASGHHAAVIIHRSRGGMLWWVSEHTLDTAPWLDVVLEGPFRRGLVGYDIQ